MLLYLSKNLADQLYARFQPRIDEQSFTDTEQTARTFVRTLETAISAVFGSAKGSMGVQSQSTHAVSSTGRIVRTSEDRALLLFEHFLSGRIDITEDRLHRLANINHWYTFSLPFNVKRAHRTQGTHMVAVSYFSPEIRLSGLTSEDNWLSKSLLNSVVLATAKPDFGRIQLNGILIPLSINNRETETEIIVQYIALFDPRNVIC